MRERQHGLSAMQGAQLHAFRLNARGEGSIIAVCELGCEGQGSSLAAGRGRAFLKNFYKRHICESGEHARRAEAARLQLGSNAKALGGLVLEVDVHIAPETTGSAAGSAATAGSGGLGGRGLGGGSGLVSDSGLGGGVGLGGATGSATILAASTLGGSGLGSSGGLGGGDWLGGAVGSATVSAAGALGGSGLSSGSGLGGDSGLGGGGLGRGGLGLGLPHWEYSLAATTAPAAAGLRLPPAILYGIG